MMHIFNDETDNGKLYINYPMVEAYMDMDCWADEEYLTKSISASISNGKLYKSEVISKWVYYDINICNKIFDKVKMCLKGVERELRKVAALEATDSILPLKVEGNAYWKGVYIISVYRGTWK